MQEAVLVGGLVASGNGEWMNLNAYQAEKTLHQCIVI